jgi:hypothetical protein
MLVQTFDFMDEDLVLVTYLHRLQSDVLLFLQPILA